MTGMAQQRRQPRGVPVGGEFAVSRHDETTVVLDGRPPVTGRSLADRFPELAAEWHPTLNEGVVPSEVSYATKRKVWWECSKCGNVWDSKVKNRSTRGSGCPECGRVSTARAQRTPKPGGSFADHHPELVGEWHPTLNGDVTLADVSYGSSKKSWWLCGSGHEWEAIVANRSAGHGCPKCSVEAKARPQPGGSFADRHPELVGEWHPTLNGDVTPSDVGAGSGKKVWWKCAQCGHPWEAQVCGRSDGHGCPRCGMLAAVAAAARPKLGESLADRKPEIAAAWHPSRNGDLKPSDVGFGSQRKVWWECAGCGDPWEAGVGSRKSPLCAKCALAKHNAQKSQPKPGRSLLERFPDAAAGWHPTKNGDLTAADVNAGSSKKVWWQCPEGHEWETKIDHRARGSGCPKCAGRK